ncbi:MAG: hypothetical protein ACK42L_06580, partial [Thermoanaerobaculum sp.]
DDVMGALEQHPEWSQEVRRLLLTDALLKLPALVQDLAKEVRQLAEAQGRTEQQVAALVQAQQQPEARVALLVEAQRQLLDRMVRMEGCL